MLGPFERVDIPGYISKVPLEECVCVARVRNLPLHYEPKSEKSDFRLKVQLCACTMYDFHDSTDIFVNPSFL